MDHNSNRKASWDSKMSISTISTRHFRRSPSSIISSDSDIRFTRKKLSSQYKCGCFIIACFLLLLLLAAAAVYVGYTYFLAHPLEEQIFRATFKVIEGDTFSPELTDPNTESFKTRCRDYKERLNLLFRRSRIKYGFAGTEVLALDGTEGKDLVVHFNIHIDPVYANVNSQDLTKLISDQIELEDSIYFQNITVDVNSLEVLEHNAVVTTTVLPSTKFYSQPITQTPPPPRKCSPVQLSYCSKLPYNKTTYPNLLGHRNFKEVQEDVIAFRELVDGECYHHAYDFVCQVLQPSCKKGSREDEMILPCRSFCRDFLMGCGSRLLPKFKDLLDCSRFPESGSCKAKPDCVQDMQSRALSPRICDGVVDCQDLSDETTCAYCPSDQIHCGIGRSCIHASKRCDGQKDCPDGSDERACLSLAPSVDNITKIEIVTPHLPHYYSDGFVVFNEKGEVGKLCTENLNRSLPENRTAEILHMVASSLCKTLTYQKVHSVRVEKDQEANVSYVIMKDPTANEINFVRSPCHSRQVLKISCADLECGVQSTHGPNALQTLQKMASHGDWPWHVALFKEDVHVCDGTLLSSEWLITTASCFQGQPKAEWMARFGMVRLTSTTPWAQERRIIGMVKSPVEGSTIAMVRLEEPVIYSDFVRPVCLSDKMNVQPNNMSQCNTLGWARNREVLQRVQVKVAPMEKCENISIASANSLCTEATFGRDDCNEEEFAGSSMLCLLPDGMKWSLVGITNWRIACPKSIVGRPRMYDKITSNVEWIHETINNNS